MGNGGYSQFLTHCFYHFFLCRGSTTLLPCFIVGYLPWKTVLPEFLQCGFFPWAALLHELLQCWSPAWGAILQAQTAAAWVLWRVRSPASKPAPGQAPLSMGPLVLPEACPE